METTKHNPPLVIEVFADNGEHSHWNLIDQDTGDILWEETEPLDKPKLTAEELKFHIKLLNEIKAHQELGPMTNSGVEKIITYLNHFASKPDKEKSE